jgi:CHAT domain-containing protein/Tfp pilus assembly protein PilF
MIGWLNLISSSRKRLSLLVLALLVLITVYGPSVLATGTGPLANESRDQQQVGAKMGEQSTAGSALTPEQPVEREISAGDTHVYQLTLELGQYASLTVQQKGIDVVAHIFSPDNKPIGEVDNESRTQGWENIEVVAHASGAYRIAIAPKYKSLPPGRYEIRIAELRVATDRDEKLDEARRLDAQARREYLDDRYRDAIRTERRSLNIREGILDPEDPAVASSRFALGLYYRNAGDIHEAEEAYLQALATMEKVLGQEHPSVALVLHNLGYLYYYDLHDYTQAQAMYERALAIKEKSLGPEHPLIAATLLNMGLLQWKQKNYPRATVYYQRAREIFEKNDGPESNSVANCIHNLGIIYKESGDYVKGEACYQQALRIWEKTLGKDHPQVAMSMESLGILHRDKGDYETAESFLVRALNIEVEKEGANHPDVANTLVILARLYEAKGDMTRAVEYQSRAAEIEEKNIARNLLLGSERQKLAYFSSMTREANRRISLHVRSAPGDPRARDLALTMVLQRKGRVLDALADTAASLRQELSAQDQTLLDDVNDITARLARLVLAGPEGESTAEHEKMVKALEARREQLEEELNRRSAGFYQTSQPATIDAVRRLLPEDTALIEFVVYRPSDPRVPFERDTPADPRYVAYVLRNQGEVEWRDLGPAKDIDATVEAFRQALGNPQRKDVWQLAHSVSERVFEPLRGSLSGVRRLLISPDGELNLVPFAALADEHGQYLLERYSFTYLTSGRDLIRLRARPESKNPPTVIADPAFGGPALVAINDRPSADDSEPGKGVRIDYSQIFFSPLPGLLEEARALKTLLPQGVFLTQEQATKAAVMKLRGPAILHIATHGFFLQDEPLTMAENRNADQNKEVTRLGKLAVQTENPLLRSGLALAGANQSSNGNADGILTALEVATLNLWGTKLVVLSACDSGVGVVKNGEGVYGLRRALVLAGAESQVMSLWAAPDRSTRDLVVNYYKSLMRGTGRGEALREVQMQMHKSSTRRHPYYWAGFIQTGEWANLEGKR